MRTQLSLRSAAAAFGLTLAISSPAHADGLPGTIIAPSSSLLVEYLGSDAAYYHELYRAECTGTTCVVVGDAIFTKGTTAGSEVVINGLAAGEEVVFALFVKKSAGDAGTFYFTGDPLRNADGLGHLQSWGSGPVPGVTLPADIVGEIWGWEDKCGAAGASSGTSTNGSATCANDRSDRDFNDGLFAVSDATVTPEPISMTLLATGLAGLGGAGAVRRRKRKLD